MKKYKVLKDLPRAKAGDTLIEGLDNDLVRGSDLKGLRVLDALMVSDAIAEGFIEEVKPKRWRARYQDKYFLTGLEGGAAQRYDSEDSYDNSAYDYGNYFKSQETAELVADVLREVFWQLHSPDTQPVGRTPIMALFNRARMAVLKDDGVEDD